MQPLKILDRVGRATGGGFHSAFVTSFATEFAAFEELLVPQLMAVGCRNIGLISDARMSSLALSDGSALPRHLGRAYGLYGPPTAQGLFHPKIILQLGRDRGRAFVSSANATAAGLCGNVEIGTEIECTSDASVERGLVRAIAAYLNRCVSEPGVVRDALDWAWARAPWLTGEDDGTSDEIAFLAAPGDPGILRAFCERVEAPVERLWVLSPYWDESLKALRILRERLSAGRTSILIDAARHEFPTHVDLPNDLELVDISNWRAKRFTHAKLVIAQTAGFDHVLSGSANCTSAALGDWNSAGGNAEASLYRRFAAGEALDLLDLRQWTDAPVLAVDALPARSLAPPIPLERLTASAPGRFSVEDGWLAWTPPSHRFADPVIQLSDIDLIPLFQQAADGDQPGRQMFPLSPEGGERIRFAAVRHREGVSALAGVDYPRVLRKSRREQLSGSAAKAADWFSNAVDLEFFALEALDALCRADIPSSSPDAIAGGRTGNPSETVSEDPGQTLSYEKFMTERERPAGGHAVGESGLDGSHCDYVRLLLNRLSSLDDGVEDGEAEDGDPGNDPTLPPRIEGMSPSDRPIDPIAFERGVDKYAEASVLEHPTGARDVLRLRLWLMLLLFNARCDTLPKGLSPTVDDRGWPRLVLRVLVAFFVGPRAPIGRLVVERSDSALPKDFLETWATVLWSLEAIDLYRPATPAGDAFGSFVQKLRLRIAAALRLGSPDLAGPQIRDRMAGLDRQLGARLASSIHVQAEETSDHASGPR